MFAAPLLRYRLRWYAHATARLLLRRWQAATLIAGLGAAAGTSAFGNMETLAHPVLALLAPGHGAAWHFGYLLALLAVAALWAGMQRAQVEGGEFMAFAGALPFTARQRRHVDLAVLLLADSPLLVLVAAALAVTAVHAAPLAHPLLLCDVVLLALTVQVAVLERHPAMAAGAVAACGVLAAGLGTPLAPVLPVLSVLVGAGAATVLWRGPRPAPRRRVAAPSRRTRRVPAMPAMLAALAGRHAPAMRVSLAILLRERRGEALGKALVAGVIVAAALALVDVFERDGRSFPVILVAQGLAALAVSGLYRSLHLAHRASVQLIGSLPLGGRWPRAFDVAAVLAFGLPFLGILAAAAWAADAATPMAIAAATLTHAALLCALRAPQLYSERHAVVLGTTLAGGWTAATIACLV